MQLSAEIAQIFYQYDNGLSSEIECLAALERKRIRGGFDETGQFTGYDYENQEWITSP